MTYVARTCPPACRAARDFSRHTLPAVRNVVQRTGAPDAEVSMSVLTAVSAWRRRADRS